MFFLCGLCWTADAMEIMMLEFLFRELKIAFNLASGTDGIMSGIVFLGMFVGAFFWGMFSDRFGRRISYLITSLFVGVFGMLSAVSHNLTTFLIFRFFVGFGFGGSHTAYTLWQEFTPSATRGTMLLLNQIFWTLGAVTEALLAWWLIPSGPDGWRYLMFVSASLPFVTASFYFCLPESPRYLMVRGRVDEAAQTLRDVARANGKEFPEGTELVLEADYDHGRSSIGTLFHPALLATTLALCFIWATDTFTYYGGAFITPKFFENSSLYSAALITTAAEVPGIFLPMLTLDTIGRKATIGLLLLVAAIFFFVIAFIPDATVVLVCLCVSRMCASSAFTVTYIYTSEVYPTVARSTGLGVNSAFSRMAGFTTSFVATGLDKTTAGLIYAIMACLAGIVAFFLPYETRTRPMFDNVEQLMAYDSGGDYAPQRPKTVTGADLDHMDDDDETGSAEPSVTRSRGESAALLSVADAAANADDADDGAGDGDSGFPDAGAAFALPGSLPGTLSSQGSRRNRRSMLEDSEDAQ
jgi:MFS family permease